ncbi:sulfatase [Streptomyces sp. NBC_00820]|uniref:sulfatase n=1 Tax=Streptomyces sp. NBC_00820 TaxID=2975842 RepID=UPI002ED337FA|nr:sulfatase [Streptomyces sp. NBC_00820]
MGNVLFVSLDTVRADVAYSGRMPGIEALRRRGVTFRQAISSAPLTPISHASVFTGLQPTRHGIRHLLREKLRPDVTTIAERLRAAGYNTGAVVSCPGMNKWYGLDRGFDFYDDEIPRLPDGSDPLTVGDVKMRGLALKRAPLVVDRALEWLAGQQEPFFLFAHFFDAHWPYEPPEDVGVPVDNPYEGEVAYSDHYLQRLLAGIEEQGHALDDLLIVLFSDHGEDLAGWYPNDHAGDLGHPYEEGHGCLLFDATQHVPMIFSGPGLPRGAAVDSQVRLVDIAPTVLDLLGMEKADGDGASLTEFFTDGEGTSRPAYSETYYPEERRADGQYPDLLPLTSVRFSDDAGRRKVIWHVGGDRVDAYDLTADPHEQQGQALVVPGDQQG